MSPGDQLWFFLKEDMVLLEFTQKQYTLLDIQSKGITLQDCLAVTNTHGSTAKFAFYIHSASMAAAVRMLTDESISATYNLYCQNDPVVAVLIRDINETSPNTSRARSHNNSFVEPARCRAERSYLRYSFSLMSAIPLVAWMLIQWRESMTCPNSKK
jgi:hypothetical protein